MIAVLPDLTKRYNPVFTRLTGDSHAVIIEHAKEIGCDLMVMGAYDNRLADSLALGTTTDYLVRNSPVPVLVHH